MSANRPAESDRPAVEVTPGPCFSLRQALPLGLAGLVVLLAFLTDLCPPWGGRYNSPSNSGKVTGVQAQERRDVMIEQKLAELGMTLPEPPKPVAAYVPAVRTGNLVFVSGQLPVTGQTLLATGKVPGMVPVDQAQEAAAQCVLNGLAVLKGELDGDLSRLRRVVRIGVFVQSEDDFDRQSVVANGASELLEKLLGDAGRHARAAIGVNALPLNASVEVEFVFEVE